MKAVIIKIIASFAFLGMVLVNFLANSLPINNRSTGDISDAYPNLFAPTGLTFSIWGIIYLLLAGYLVYQFVQKNKRKELFQKINILFLATSLANIAWIFSWHYDYIALSVLIMASLLILLIKIADIIRIHKFSTWEKLFIFAPFSIYFGWITVASIANITVLLVSLNWNGFNISDVIWTSIILLVGALIGIWRTIKDKNIVYALVLVWAYIGILIKHLSAKGFDSSYPMIIVVVNLCLVAFVVTIGRIITRQRIN